MKNSILHQIYPGYEKTLREQNFLSQTYLQVSSFLFFPRSYIFPFIHQKLFYKLKKLNFPTKIYEIWKKW